METTTIPWETEETTTQLQEEIETTTGDLNRKETTTVVETTTTIIETTTELIEENEDTTHSTTVISIPLEEYAVRKMTLILNHILEAFYTIVNQVLQESQDTVYPRDKLKTYAEKLLNVLHIEDEAEEEADMNPENGYNIMLKKLNFLKGRISKNLQAYLPEDYVETYLKYRQDVSEWLDETVNEMNVAFTAYVSNDEDRVKYLYFDETFDDIPRANKIRQKLVILMDLVNIATNRRQISFTDLYMQS